ncbi:MAG: hypothetical protein JWN96_2547 [Mycobacterium sp.]|nr:hypothetical protein [Mycobacterium sp.]
MGSLGSTRSWRWLDCHSGLAPLLLEEFPSPPQDRCDRYVGPEVTQLRSDPKACATGRPDGSPDVRAHGQTDEWLSWRTAS